jgi:hypothetical protein
MMLKGERQVAMAINRSWNFISAREKSLETRSRCPRRETSRLHVPTETMMGLVQRHAIRPVTL